MNMQQSLVSVAVVILNYNNWKDTIACAESVLASTVPARFIFIVDNASNDNSLNMLYNWANGENEHILSKIGVQKSSAKPLNYVKNPKKFQVPDAQLIFIESNQNKGYAAGNNLAINLAMFYDVDAVWILNNDTIVEAQALHAMQERLFSKSRPGLCGSLVCYTDSGLVQCCAGGKTVPLTGLSRLFGNKMCIEKALQYPPETIEQEINFIYGASVMASKNFIKTVGLMDERYFLYCEEQDWAYAAKGRFDFAYAPHAIVHHKEGSTTGFSSKKTVLRSLWYLTRSRILLTYKHKAWALPTVCISIVYAGLRMIWRRLLY